MTKGPSTFRPIPWQVEPWKCKDDILLLTGAAGGGKSRLAAEKLNGFLMKYPGAMGLALRKTRQSMVNSTALFLERSIIGGLATYLPSKNRFEYPNGSILALGGMADDEQREQIRSVGQEGNVDIVWMEEANRFIEDDFNEILARMRGTAAPWIQVILSTNPDTPYHWIYRRIMTEKEGTVFYSSARDNPHNPPQYLRFLDKLTGVARARLLEGKWVRAEGAIYEDYDPDIHLIRPFKIPEQWLRFISVDFGYTNPFVAQWWAVDPDGRMYLYREIYHTHRLVEDHAATILKYSQGERISAVVCDHDAEDRATLDSRGLFTTPAKKDISPGIQAVISRLAVQGDGKPRLYFLTNSLIEVDGDLEFENKPFSTVMEIVDYSWTRYADGKPDREKPLGINDHGMDALRYAVMHLERYSPTGGIYV